MARQRALVTGLGGFTGRYVAEELEKAGYEVIGLSQRPDGETRRTVVADLLDRESVRQAVVEADPDVVLHLAAISFVAHGNVDEIYRVNVVGTRNLLEALANAPRRPELVVLASSANIYGNADVDPITEDTPPAPANDYAVSKLAMEYMARLWMDRLPIVITRPFNYTGVGQSEQFLVPKLVGHFRRSQPDIQLGNIEVVRDFCDVRDISKFYVAVLKRKPVGEKINFCSGRGVSLKHLVQTLENLAGYQVAISINPAFVRTGEVHRLVGSNQQLKSLVGQTCTIPIEETLKWMLYSTGASQ